MVRIAIAALVLLPLPAQAIGICSGNDRAERQLTCLVDGDTGWENGTKWRLVDVDTPEMPAHAECEQEPQRAVEATQRLIELMDDGYRIEWLNQKDDSGERELARIRLNDGRDAGVVLAYEGFAQPWPNTENPWCD